MRIAQIAPLTESVPPQRYGGTERVVSHLTEELVRLGHDVTLFASGDSETSARLVPVCSRALRLDSGCVDRLAPHVLMLERIAQHMAEFDIIHFHTDYLHYPLVRRLATLHLTTLHGRLDLPELQPLYREFGEVPLVSISDDQRAPLPWANWAGTVHHGLPADLYRCGDGEGGYLAFLGRIAPEKRVDRAIEIAQRTRTPLRIAAKVDEADRAYFEREIAHLLDDPLIEFIGEIGDGEKEAFLGGAAALLFPIDWPEPFGIVMIEALACGTPVIAFRRGSVPEVLEEGVTGYIVDDVPGAARAVSQLPLLRRERCRMVFEERFTARRMAADYLRIYEQLAHAAAERAAPAVATAPNARSGRRADGRRLPAA